MGKVIKHTEYYCDICKNKIQRSWIPYNKERIYKIKCYDYEGNHEKSCDYSYVCNRCMSSLVEKIQEEKRKKNAGL